MNRRRILIGSMIGILTFTIMTWVNSSTWNALESQLLQGRSSIRIFNPFPKSQYLVLEFDEDNKLSFDDRTRISQRETLMNLVTELAAKEVNSMTLVTNKFNPLEIDEADLEVALGNFEASARTISAKDLETIWQKEDGSILWLDRKQHKFPHYSVADLVEDIIPPEIIHGSNILFISPKVDPSSEDSNLMVNFLDDRWVNYFSIPAVLMFMILIGTGILLAAMVYWARILAFFALSLAALALGQLVFSVFNIHIETVPLIASFITILIISNLFDLNLIAINRKAIFQSSRKPNQEGISDPTVVMTTPFIKTSDSGLNPNTINELRSKFYHEQESNYEDIALEFQEKTVRSINGVQDKIEELLESNELVDRDRTKLSLLKHNFDHMIEEFDAILFNLVPFRFEDDKGIINLLDIYTNKTFLLSKGKVQLSLDSEFTSLKLPINHKINAYRILQKLVELIKEANQDQISTGMIISINIHGDSNSNLKFRITYEGIPIDSNSASFKLSEIYKRIGGLEEGDIDFGNTALAEIANNLTNHIEFKFKTALPAIKDRVASNYSLSSGL